MLMRVVTVIYTLCLLIGCAAHKNSSTIQEDTQKGPLPSFTQVKVIGNIDVTLYSHDAHSGVTLDGDPRDIKDIKMHVRDGILYVDVGKGYPHYGRLHANIHTYILRAFTYNGTGTIIGKNIRSRLLDVVIHNNGNSTFNGNMRLQHLKLTGSGVAQFNGLTGHNLQVAIAGTPHVQLGGIIDVASINMHGHGWLSLHWLKSRQLKLRAHEDTFIQIAGRAEVYDVELWDHAQFNGRYLRGHQVFVKTHNQSEANIAVTYAQHTLAYDTSNIYFHALPLMKADFMADSGAVLDFREWEQPFMQEYTHYNR